MEKESFPAAIFRDGAIEKLVKSRNLEKRSNDPTVAILCIHTQ